MALDTYANLQTAIGTHLNRTDLADYAPDFIKLAEAKFARDPRLRYLTQASISVGSDGYSLPTGFKELVALYHDGSTYYGPLVVVSPDELANHKGFLGDSGVPQKVAIVGTANPTLRFAPEPNQTFTFKIIYNTTLRGNELSGTNTSNWLLSLAPDIYLYGALIEAEAFLQEDQRIQLWKAMLEESLRQFYVDQQRKEYSGTLSRFPARGIGSDV